MDCKTFEKMAGTMVTIVDLIKYNTTTQDTLLVVDAMIKTQIESFLARRRQALSKKLVTRYTSSKDKKEEGEKENEGEEEDKLKTGDKTTVPVIEQQKRERGGLFSSGEHGQHYHPYSS